MKKIDLMFGYRLIVFSRKIPSNYFYILPCLSFHTNPGTLKNHKYFSFGFGFWYYVFDLISPCKWRKTKRGVYIKGCSNIVTRILDDHCTYCGGKVKVVKNDKD